MSAAATKPASDLARSGYLPRLPSWSATSVPGLRLELEADHLELGVGIDLPGGGQELHVGEIRRQAEAPRELGDVVRVAREALDLDHAIVLLERREPQALGIPARIVDGSRVIAAKLGEDVGIDGGAVAVGENARQLEQHRRRPAARLLKLGDGFFSRAEGLELGFDLGVVRHGLLDLLDLAVKLVVLAHLPRQLLAFDLMDEEEDDDLGDDDAEHGEQPALIDLRAAPDFSFLREKVDANHERFSLSLRIASPRATASCGP